MIRNLKMFLILAALLTSTVNARIGETYKKCASRYGKVDIQEKGHVEFIKGNTRIICKFSPKGYCYAITFMNVKNNAKQEFDLEVSPLSIIKSWGIKGLKGSDGQYTNGRIIINYDSAYLSAYDAHYLNIRN